MRSPNSGTAYSQAEPGHLIYVLAWVLTNRFFSWSEKEERVSGESERQGVFVEKKGRFTVSPRKTRQKDQGEHKRGLFDLRS